SYGGISSFLDGSDPASQAIDAAFVDGMLSFISAGNDGNDAVHMSRVVEPAQQQLFTRITINNQGAEMDTVMLDVRFLWRDENPGNESIVVLFENANENDPDPEYELNCAQFGTSPRGTETVECELEVVSQPETTQAYNINVLNLEPQGDPTKVHAYIERFAFNETTDIFFSGGAFPNSSFTINEPAVADNAMAVGAWVHRNTWTDADGVEQSNGQFVNSLASFSSRGPRIDEVIKPDIVAPGSATISTRDGDPILVADPVEYWIDDDGIINPNDDDDSHYLILQGTSMASPMAAGSAALLLESNPLWLPSQVRAAMKTTASNALNPNSSVGSGLLDLPAAMQTTCSVVYDVYWGPVDGPKTRICSDVSQTVCPAPNMTYGQDYEWYVLEKRPVGSRASEKWTYSTGCPIIGSLPTACEYEARQPHPPADGNDVEGLDQVTLILESASASFDIGDISVDDGTGDPPQVISISQDDQELLVTLNRPITPGVWTSIGLAGCGTVVGFFPGDANEDAVTNYDDVTFLTEVLDGSETAPIFHTDINRDLEENPEDLLRLIDLLNGGDEYDSWLNVVRPECPLTP
ncbi:MAG: S8 family serine peptidase, partial [Planctomycetota bacterium]